MGSPGPCSNGGKCEVRASCWDGRSNGRKSSALALLVAILLEEISAPPETPPLRSRHSRANPSQCCYVRACRDYCAGRLLCRALRCRE
jgi:hypothetical protein